MTRSLIWDGGHPVIISPPLVATRRQIRLALGEGQCALLDAAQENPLLPWTMRDALKSTYEFHRTAPEIDEFAWLLGMTSDDVDALFGLAMTL